MTFNHEQFCQQAERLKVGLKSSSIKIFQLLYLVYWLLLERFSPLMYILSDFLGFSQEQNTSFIAKVLTFSFVVVSFSTHKYIKPNCFDKFESYLNTIFYEFHPPFAIK